MRNVSKEYMTHMMNNDISDINTIRNSNGILKIEVNSHTYELTPWGKVIACFDGLNYVYSDGAFFRNLYTELLKKA